MSLLDGHFLDAVRVESVFSRPVLAHPALRQFANECRAIAVRLMAYVGGLAALAVIAADLLSGSLGPEISAAVAAPAGPVAVERWTQAFRPHPAFSVVSPDLSDKTARYEILRHANGGRKDIIHWTNADGVAIAGLALYRPGSETESTDNTPESALADIASIQPGSVQPLGVIDSKFGPVQLLGATEVHSSGRRQCLAALKVFAEPRMRLGFLFCHGDTGAAARAQMTCAVNRLTLLAAGSDPQLIGLFARADLKGRDCKIPATVSRPADWLSAMTDPGLRGRL